MLTYILRVASLTVMYGVAAKLALQLAEQGGTVVAPVWPAAGLGLAMMWLRGGRLWLGVVAGTALAMASAGVAWPVAVGLGAANAAGAGAALVVLRRQSFDARLHRVVHVVRLLAVVACVQAPLAAVLGAAVTALGGGDVPPGFSPWNPVAVWLAEALGCLVTAPLVLTWTTPPGPHPHPQPLEMAAVAGVLVVSFGVAFSGWVPVSEDVPLTYLAFLPVLWSIRFGMRAVSAAIAGVVVLAVTAMAAHPGRFVLEGGAGQPMFFGVFGLVVVATGLLLAAAQTEAVSLAAALATARTEAERAMSAKTRLLAAVRHDLAQPLNAAILFADLLHAHADPRDTLVVERLRAALQILANTLGTVRDVTLFESGLVHPAPRRFALTDILDQVAAEYAIQATYKGLAWRYVASRAVVRTDPDLLGRVVRNLLSNALRYTDSGRVLLGCRHERGWVRIEVWDTGPGIAPDHLDTIFQEFHRLGGESGPEGMGLGLAIVDRVARLLDLRVRVRSRLGRGSTFSVAVARDDKALAPPSA